MLRCIQMIQSYVFVMPRHRAGSSRASTEGGSVCAPTELVDRLIPKVPGVDENRFTTTVVPPIKATKLIEH